MHALSTLFMGLMAFQSALASPAPTTYSTSQATLSTGCAKPTTTTTTTPIRFGVCPVCIVPTSTCSSGEATGPTPRPPTTSTLAVSQGACTETVQVVNNPGCNNCATCTSAAMKATSSATAASTKHHRIRATTLPGGEFCSPTTTVTTTVAMPTSEICACAAELVSQCSSGQPTASPLPTTTLTEGCVEEIIVGPGNCANVCPTCAY